MKTINISKDGLKYKSAYSNCFNFLPRCTELTPLFQKSQDFAAGSVAGGPQRFRRLPGVRKLPSVSF